MVLAGALACIPAQAQSWWSSLDMDAYGNIAGASVTEVPYFFPDFGYDAYVEGLLNDPNGAEVVDVTAFDNGQGYAEADTYSFALIAGDYGQYGNHDVFTYDEYLYEVLGASQAFALWSPTNCISPDGENSTAVAQLNPSQPDYGTLFTATVYAQGLGSSYFQGTTVTENVTLGPDACWWDGAQFNPFYFSFGGNAPPWTVDSTNTYSYDSIRQPKSNGPDFYQALMKAGEYTPGSSCTLFYDSQAMSHSCTGMTYQTNTNTMDIFPNSMYITRDNATRQVE